MNYILGLSVFIKVMLTMVILPITCVLVTQLISYQVFNFSIANYLLNQINGKELYKINKHSSKRKMHA